MQMTPPSKYIHVLFLPLDPRVTYVAFWMHFPFFLRCGNFGGKSIVTESCEAAATASFRVENGWGRKAKQKSDHIL